MAEQWMDLLQHIPPGTDVFDFIQDMLTDEMFPDFGKTYWDFVYVSVALLSLTFVAIVLAFYFKIRNKGFAWMIVQDGACTHISPKAWVSFFWGVMCILLIAQIAWMRIVFTTKIISGSFVAYSVVLGAIPVISLACLTLHVLTNAPPLRRLLIRFSNASRNSSVLGGWDRSVVLINMSLFIWCVFAGGILALPGRKAYKQGEMARETFASAIKILREAKTNQNIADLAKLTPIMSQFQIMEATRHDTNRISGYIFGPFFTFYLFSTILPAILLNVYIRNRIKDYDLGISAAQTSFGMTSSWPHLQQHDSFVPAQPPSEMVEQLKDDSRPITIHLPHKLPKDRPFANIIEVRHTTAAPQHLQRIMDMKGTNPADKSARLKTALRRDNQMLLAYCILLAAMGSLAFWQLTGGEALRTAFLWEIYSFAIPASFLAAIFLFDAVRNDKVDNNDVSDTSVTRPFSRHKATAALPNVITLRQDVSIREEYAMDDKPGRDEKESVYKPYS